MNKGIAVKYIFTRLNKNVNMIFNLQILETMKQLFLQFLIKATVCLSLKRAKISRQKGLIFNQINKPEIKHYRSLSNIIIS